MSTLLGRLLDVGRIELGKIRISYRRSFDFGPTSRGEGRTTLWKDVL